MRFILKEINNNIKSMKMYFFVIIFSIIFCFQILSSNQLKISNVRNVTDKYFFAKYELDSSNKLMYKDILDNYKDIKFYNILYKFPKNFDVEKRIGRYRINNNFFSIYNTDSNYRIYSGKLPDINSKNFEIAIPLIYSLDKNIKIGDFIEIDNLKLKVIGLTDFTTSYDAFVVSPKIAEELKLSLSNLIVNLNESIDKDKRINIYEEIGDKIKSSPLIDTSGKMKENIEKMGPIIFIVLSVSILNILFVYWNILNNRKKKYFTYKFLGIKKKFFYKMLLMETVAVYMISFLIALGLFIFIDTVVLKLMLNINRYELRLDSVLFVFGLFLILLLVFTYFVIRKYFKKSIIEIYKENI